jgi:hypothetical protein
LEDEALGALHALALAVYRQAVCWQLVAKSIGKAEVLITLTALS